jgi:hypothetical protein
MLAFCTSIAEVSLVLATDTVTQQQAGTSINVTTLTLKKSPTAAGVTIAVALPRGSPLIDNATDIGSTVSPVDIAMFALNCTL